MSATGRPDAPAAAPPTHWPAVWAAALSGAAIATQVGKVPPAIAGLRTELGLTLVQAGWVSATLTTLSVLAALAVGLLAGRIGAWRMVMGGLLLGAAASAAGTAASGFAWLITLRAIEGAGFLAVAVAAPGLVTAASAPADRRLALGVWATYMPLGAGLTMALSPLLLPGGGWRALWWLAAAALLAAAAAVWAQRARYAAVGSSSPATALRPTLAVLRQPLPWLYGLAFGLWAVQHYALIVWMPSYLREQRGLGPAGAALLTCAMLLACVPGNLVGGLLLQRGWSRGRMIVMAHAITGTCGWACFSESLPDALRFAASVALSFTGGLIPTAALSSSALLARSPQQIAAVQGLVMQLTQLGQFAGTPAVAAVVAASGHWSSARQVTAAAALAGIAMGLLARRYERRLPMPAPAAPPAPTPGRPGDAPTMRA